jgi:hypothetical protein
MIQNGLHRENLHEHAARVYVVYPIFSLVRPRYCAPTRMVAANRRRKL